MVVKKKKADISLVSRVRATAGTRQNNSEKHGKNSKNTTRRATSVIWSIFAELGKPKRRRGDGSEGEILPKLRGQNIFRSLLELNGTMDLTEKVGR